MIHPLPPGTRDVLPDEMRELRALSERLRASFDAAGYGEVYTPSVEYEDTLRRGDERTARAGVYRLFDERGRVLVMRSDTTLSIARLVATRYGGVRPPVRLCYFAHAYRTVERGRGQAREFLQGGVELIGPKAPEGEAEVLSLVVGALSDAGLRRHRVGLGDGSLVRELLTELEVAPERRGDLLEHLSRRDLVALEMEAKALGLSEAACEVLVTLPSLRGGPEVLDRAHGPVGRAVGGLRTLFELLAERGVGDRVILDLGLVRELGYYTGAVYEVYDPAVGYAIGGGGRYDELLGRFGTPLPACGLALDIGRVHAAQAAEERLG
jgi:ATP phosphoribosyltransferase regulatory subunit